MFYLKICILKGGVACGGGVKVLISALHVT